MNSDKKKKKKKQQLQKPVEPPQQKEIKQWEIPENLITDWNEIEIEKEIGKGPHGTIFFGTWQHAVKHNNFLSFNFEFG